MPYLRLKNIGPIKDFECELKHGVTLVCGPAGCGKSTILKAIQVVASGKGRPPLRDGAKVGTVEAAGAHLTVSGKTTRNGELELPNLEGRFDLSMLVDPGVAQQAAADARRIKALVALTGAKGGKERFTKREEFADLEQVAPPEALDSDDLVDQAARIKRAYEDSARKLEDQAKTADGHAKGCEPPEELDLDAECDATKLRKAYDEARDRCTTLITQRNEWTAAKGKAEKAIEAIEAADLPDATSLEQAWSLATEVRLAAEKNSRAAIDEVESLRKKLEKAEAKRDQLLSEEREKEAKEEAAEQAFERAAEAHAHVAEQRAIVDSFTSTECPVSDESLSAARNDVTDAEKAVERGTLIREARERKAKGEVYKADAANYRKQAEKRREAAHAVDHVLSEAIQCERFRIEAQDGVATLLAPDDEHGGEWVPYWRLSDGQRWREAINLAADRVGENGLIPIPQGAWGELSGETRAGIVERAKARKVYVLSAEVTQTTEDSAKGLHAVTFGLEPTLVNDAVEK